MTERKRSGSIWKWEIRLQDQALLLFLLFGQESGTRGVLKDLADTFVGLGGTLEVLVAVDLSANLLTLFP
jgi:hypothetical protein